jgi:hypothetical protein
MTTDQLDALGHRAADELRASLHDLDTEAALADLLAGRLPAPHDRLGRSGGGRRLGVAAMVAAAVAAVVGVAVVTRIAGPGDERVGTGSKPVVEPGDYGGRLGSLVSQQDPSLRVEVYGPEPLGAADQVAVSIQGGRPGQRYGLQLCRREGLPVNNPATSCTSVGSLTVASDGQAVEVVRLPAVYMGVVPIRQNDCRKVACDLIVEAVIEDDEPDAGVPGTRFVDQSDPWYRAEGPGAPASPWIPLSFDPAADVGPLASMALLRAPEGSPSGVVRIEGQDLAPGRLSLAVYGFEREPTGPFGEVAAVAVAPLTTVEVADDGTFSADLDLPGEVVDGAGDGDGSAQVEGSEPPRVDCTSARWACQVRATWVGTPPTVDGVPALVPEPLGYPAG